MTIAGFAQRGYRHDCIIDLLTASPHHGANTTMHLDKLSKQAERLAPHFHEALGGSGSVAQALR